MGAAGVDSSLRAGGDFPTRSWLNLLRYCWPQDSRGRPRVAFLYADVVPR
ncbi:MAG: hypothetical protein IT193_08640 [Propionibacteriaceae bacterium]|nr:hypothetical protein [Propionibacteriaceae bacterium]